MEIKIGALLKSNINLSMNKWISNLSGHIIFGLMLSRLIAFDIGQLAINRV